MCEVKEKVENIAGKMSIAGNGRKEDRHSAVQNGLVKVSLLFRESIAIPSGVGEAVDGIDMLWMRSRVKEK